MLTWLEINKTALLHNITQIRSLLRPTDKLAPVIKSNAYGHGMITIAQLLDHEPYVAFFCCASLSEAAQCRQAGIQKPLLVLGILDQNPALFDDTIEFTVGDLHTAYYLNNLGQVHKRLFRIHIKVDTGLSRFGFLPQELAHACAIIKQLSYLKITGLYTHFADAQEEDCSYTNYQIDQFNSAYNQCMAAEIKPSWIHAANSAATLAYDLPLCNVFRVGLSMYGYWPSNAIKQKVLQKNSTYTLIPVLSWKTQIIGLKEVPPNTYIGYKKTFKTNKHMLLGILPIGYFDGYDFRFSNNSVVRINDRYAPIIGRICMNLCMIDVGSITSIQTGTSVTVLGPETAINAQTLATHVGQDNVRPLLSVIAPHITRIIVEQHNLW